MKRGQRVANRFLASTRITRFILLFLTGGYMNYRRIYDLIIESARNQKRSKKTHILENHHIIPRCLKGTDDETNLVLLTPKEHYVCHRLLAKLYPHNNGLYNAWFLMSMRDGIPFVITAKEYQFIRYNAQQLFKEVNKGKALVKDNDGNLFKVDVDDPDLVSGKLVGHTKGKSVVKDNTGKYFQVDSDDPRIQTGELVGGNIRKMSARNKYGEYEQINVNDYRLKSGELVAQNKGRVLAKDSCGKYRQVSVDDSRLKTGELRTALKGNIVAKDLNGNTFIVDKHDPRVLSGELVHHTTGTASVKDINGNRFRVPVDDVRIKSGELVGLKAKPVIVNGIKYPSLRFAANQLGISTRTLGRSYSVQYITS